MAGHLSLWFFRIFNLNMKSVILALKLVFKNPLYIFLALSLTFNLLLLYYFFFSQVTTFKVFFESNSAFYNWTSLVLTILIAVFFGIAVTLLLWQWREQKENNPGDTTNTFFGTFLGALSVGCPVCGAFLFSLLGIGGGLFIFPFQGLEIKVISLGLLGFAIFSSARAINNRACGLCQPAKTEAIFGIKNRKLVINLSKETLKPILPLLIGFSLLILVSYLPVIAQKFNFRFSFQPASLISGQGTNLSNETPSVEAEEIFSQINPAQGYEIKAVYGNIGPRLLAVGAIDFEKMKSLYEKAGFPLTDEQIKILKEGSNEKIKITPENSYFLLNLLWALGITNKNQILEDGPMMKYGANQIGNFASTGGWTLGKKKATDLYSRFEIIKLTPGQQAILEDFAYNSYRPCCSNPTAFPDCNHGAAALALGEIMAAQGATAEEIFDAFKYFNAFWFPQTYFDVATYFKAKEGKDWSQVDGRIVAGKDYSTPQGWQRVRQWLVANNLLEEAPAGGGGCGV